MTHNIFNLQPRTVLKADHQCEFELFDPDDPDCQGKSNLVFGYCVVNTQAKEHHYVAIEQGTDFDSPLTVYPPSKIVGSTVFISFNNSLVQCWSLDQFNLAASSWCASISPLKSILK